MLRSRLTLQDLLVRPKERKVTMTQVTDLPGPTNVREASLPDWAVALDKGKIEVDAEKFYPAILGELGVAEQDVDQYWLELAKTFMKFEVRLAIAGTALMPKSGGASVIYIVDGSKASGGVSDWAQDAHAKGQGAIAGAKDAREAFKRLRGVLPA